MWPLLLLNLIPRGPVIAGPSPFLLMSLGASPARPETSEAVSVPTVRIAIGIML